MVVSPAKEHIFIHINLTQWNSMWLHQCDSKFPGRMQLQGEIQWLKCTYHNIRNHQCWRWLKQRNFSSSSLIKLVSYDLQFYRIWSSSVVSSSPVVDKLWKKNTEARHKMCGQSKLQNLWYLSLSLVLNKSKTISNTLLIHPLFG